MPHTLFTIRETARYLHLAEDDVRQLVQRRDIPFETQRDQPMFRRNDLDVWASRRILGMSGQNVHEYHKKAAERVRNFSSKHALMPELITPERIDLALHSRTKSAVLRDMTALAERTELVSDPKDLLAALTAREDLCSTAMPDGYALLHPRHHEPYMFLDCFMILARTAQPIHAGAPDGAPTSLFFLVCCHSDAIHLHTLARLCTMAQHTPLIERLQEATTPAEAFAALCESEMRILQGDAIRR